MEYWLARGFALKGTGRNTPGMFIASKPGKHGVLVTDFWDTLQLQSVWYSTVEQAEAAAHDMALATV